MALPENADTPVKLKHDLNAFGQSVARMARDQAANEWLELVDRFASLHVAADEVTWSTASATDPDNNAITFQQVIAALPPPPAWKPLATALEARKPDKKHEPLTMVLKVMAHWLEGNVAAARDDVTALQKQAGTRGGLQPYAMGQLESGLIENSDNGDEILTFLNQRLQTDANVEYSPLLKLPDLVTLVGEQKASDLLRNALRTEKGEIFVDRGEATKKLARKIALEMASELKGAQWALADSLDSTALYEAMVKRFPSSDRDRYQRATAESYYLLGLIAAHRTADAVSFAMTLADMKESLSEEAVAALERAGYTRDLANFFHNVLEKNPNLPFWNDYVTLAAKAGQNDQMVALAESAAGRSDLDEKQKRVVLSELHRAYLAADKIDRGIEILHQEINAKPGSVQELSAMDWYRSEYDDPAMRLIARRSVRPKGADR